MKKFLLLLIIAIAALHNVSLSAQNVVLLPENGTGPVQTANSGILKDNGGDNNYVPGGFASITISPTVVSCPLTLTFTGFDLTPNFDYLYLYDGPSSIGPMVGFYTGNQIPNEGLPIESESGSFTIEMYSEIIIFPPSPGVNQGFTAIWQAGDSSTDAAFTASGSDVPANTPVQFTPNATGYDSYFWNFGDGNSSTDINPLHTFATQGTYTVSLTITNCEGASATQSLEISIQEPPAISVVPNSFDVSLAQGDSVTYSFTITNNGSGDLVFDIEGANLISEKELQVVSLINGADLDQEYAFTLDAIYNYYSDFQLTELTTYSASVLEAALQTADVLLIPEQESCNAAAFTAFASVLQAFAQNGGTIVINGTNQSNCIFNTGLFSGTYQNFYSGPLDIELPDDPLMQGVSNPYNALAVTYYFDITNPDAVRLVEHSGYDVVCYRNIGLGRAILLGHDYRYHNSDMDRIIANCISTTKDLLSASGGIDWLYISANADTLSPGESVTIQVEFNATDVYGGLFNQTLLINSNDAGTPQVSIPCSLLVTGTPDFAISETNHDFGEVLENDTARHNITIFNPGTDSLRVYNITFSDPAFTASPATFAVYGGGTEQTVELRFVPTAIAPYSATATIETNLINFFITVSGTGVGAPVTTVTPAAINITLDAGTATTVPLTINNAGQGPLFYNIDTSYFQQQLKVLAYTSGADIFAYPNTLAAINTYFTDYQLTETQTANSDELASLLQDVNVLLVPAITDFNVFNLFDSFQLVLQEFVNQGGSIIYLGNFSWGDNPVLHSGFFDGYSSWNSGNVCNILDETHPITQGVENPYTPFGITPMIFFDTDLVRLVQQPGFDVSPGDVACYKEIGTGKVIYIGHDFGSTGDDSGARMLSNSLKWIGSQTILEWFNISSVEGTIGYPDSETLTVTLDATELVGGTYTTQIVISNNDPLAETITIPVTLTVVGIPAIEVSETSLNFGNVIIGNTEMLEIEINNPGTDSLFLDIVSGLPEFVVVPSSATIEPYGSITLQVTFIPDEIELLNGQIFLNNNANNIVVNVTGYGQGAPVIGVNPPSLEVTLLAGETTTQTLTITNTGAGPLEFTTNGDATIPILAWTYQVNTLNYSGLAGALAETGLSYALEETDTDNPDEMTTLLQGKRILLIPDQNFSSSPVFTAMAPVMDAFVQNGGTVLFLANQCDFCITQTGLFSGYIWAYLFNNVVAVLNEDHPLSTGLGTSYTSSANSIAYYFTNPDVTALTDIFTGGSTLSYRLVGSGKVIYVGDNYTDYTPAELTMLKNALQWGGAPPSWIGFNPTAGTVEVGESFTITVSFDANNLLAGTYNFDFNILSNDPATPIITVPCIMNVLAFPQAVVAAQPTYSCDGIVYFYDQSLNNPTSWSWNFGDGTTAGIQNPIHSYTENGTYTVTLEACNDLGCDETVYTNLITVDFASVYCDTTDMPFQGTIATITGCHGVLRDSGGEQNYLGGANGIVTIAPVGATQVILNFSEFIYITDFEFSDQLLIYDGPDVNSPILGIYTGSGLPNGGTVTSTGGAITIQEFTYGWLGTASGFVATWDCVVIDSPPVPSFSYEVTNACLGTVEFTDETGNYPAEWSWDFTDGGTSDEQDPTHSFLQSGTYDVVLTSCNIAGCNSVTLPVTLSGVLFVNFTVPQYIQINSPVMFMDNTANATYWQWSFGNGQTAVGNVQNPVTFYSALGVYTVTLTVTDSNGCVRTASQTVTVVQDIGIGNNPQNAQTLQLFPNPATETVNLQIQLPAGNQTAGLSLYNATGQQVLAEQLQANGLLNHQLNVGNLSKGLYWVVLQTQSGLVTQKLVVQ